MEVLASVVCKAGGNNCVAIHNGEVSLSDAQEVCHRNIFNQYQQEMHLGRTSYISSCAIQYYKDIIVIRNRSYKYSDDCLLLCLDDARG